MNRILKIALFLSIVDLSVKAQILLKMYNDSLIAFSWSGGDEFNASGLDEGRWINGIGGRRVLMTQDLAFSPRNVIFREGTVQFKANREDSLYVLRQDEVDSAFIKKENISLDGKKFPVRYSAGAIVSRNKFHYGLYEIRFKVEEGKGVWPAFWFYGGNKNEEIDVFELKGEKNNKIHVDTHCPTGCDNFRYALGLGVGWGGWMPVSDYLHEGFNNMFLEWKPEELIWYLNGHAMAYFKGKFSNPMKLFLNTSVAKTNGAFSPGPDSDSRWPVNYYVDYFRSWKQMTEQDTLKLNIKGHLDRSALYAQDYGNRPLKKSGPLYSKKNLSPQKGFISLTVNGQKQLTLVALGNWKDDKIYVKVNTANGNRLTEPVTNEITFGLQPEDSQLEVLIISGKKQYSRKIAVNR